MSIQSFRHFMADPAGYVGFHTVTVGSNNAVIQAMTAAAPENCIGADLRSQLWTPRTVAPPAVVYLDMVHMIGVGDNPAQTNWGRFKSQLAKLPGVAKPGRQFALMPRADDIGFRWLQFVENTCTYMQIDPAAQFIITGPLSGCTIAAGMSMTGQRWLLHANCNRVQGEGARTNQEAMLTQVCRTRTNIAPAARRDAVYGRDYNGMGFVFGKRLAGGAWAFYAYGSESGVRKFGEF